MTCAEGWHGRALIGAAVRAGGWTVARARARARDPRLTIGEVRGEDGGQAVGDADAVDERLAAQVVVDEGGDDTELGEPQPGAHVLRAAAHVQRHRVALLEARAPEHVGHPVTVLLDLTGHQQHKRK